MGQGTAMGKGFHPAQPIVTSQPFTQEAEAAAATFIATHKDTVDALRASEEANASLKMQLNDIMRENSELREKLETSEARCFFLQGYAVEITTHLDNLKSVTSSIVEKAVAKARENGVKIARSRQPETPEAHRDVQQAAGGVINRLPTVSP